LNLKKEANKNFQVFSRKKKTNFEFNGEKDDENLKRNAGKILISKKQKINICFQNKEP
jgi:hypothetical protein